ncbi:hypothetical protein WJX84_004706 [Apatococcus fuscideae]|uniref:Potassium transporter n=2 Tax=Apatococcus fuscideae TaxID=2026836 RepID=A0AAW1T1T3_9CHLO
MAEAGSPGVQQQHRNGGRAALWLHAYQSLGVVYGDLGTSPLYVFPAVFTVQPTQADVLGSVSLIIWLVTLMVVVKYACIVLFAEDRGEGGVFAMFSLICRHLQINPTACKDLSPAANPRRQLGVEGSSRPMTRMGALLKSSTTLQRALLGLAFLGIGAMISDGILVPAIEVISAIQGLQFKVPSLSQGAIVGISCAILVLLFLGQSYGTSKLGHVFAPVLVLFFVSNAAVGVYNIVRYMPGVFKAASPHFAYLFFMHNPKEGWIALGSIALSFSGVEAMSADMGHFSRSSITLAALGFVYPSLLLIYFGFGAFLATHTDQFANAYYTCIPDKVFWPCFVIATAASIVASQPLISSTYSVLRQSMNLCCFPRVKVVHTSSNVEGQVYIPEANYMLLVISVAALAGFQNGNDIGNALSVTLTAIMFITTILITLIMVMVWRLPAIVAATFFLVFGFIEVILLSSALYKVPDGAWFPLAVAAISIFVTLAWHLGQTSCISLSTGPPPTSFVPLPLKSTGASSATPQAPLTQALLTTGPDSELSDDGPLHRTPGVGIFLLDNLSFTTAAGWTHFFHRTLTIPEVAIFLEVKQDDAPFVEAAFMFDICRHAHHPPGVFQVTHRRGFMDTFSGPALVTDLLQAVLGHLQGSAGCGALPQDARKGQQGGESVLPHKLRRRSSEMPPGPLMDGRRDPESDHLDPDRSRPSTGSPSHAAASGALTPLCREPSSMLGVNEPGADAAAGDNGDDLPVSSPSQYRRSSLRAGTALTNWLDGNSPLQPRDADGLQPGGGQGGRALAVRLCSVLAGALREGAACWTEQDDT